MKVRLSIVLGVVLVALAAAGTATASFTHVAQIDTVGQQLSGYPDLVVAGENDPNEWGQFLAGLGETAPPTQVLGFVDLFAAPGSLLYHRIFVGPVEWPALLQARSGDWSNIYTEAVAIFDLTHEATHFKLASMDEGRVNACTLAAFPTVLSTYFGVPATVSQSTPVVHYTPVYKKVRRVSYARVHGRRVRRIRLVRKRTGTKVTLTDGPPVALPNPVYTSLVADAQAFYASQPPPYSTGSCF